MTLNDIFGNPFQKEKNGLMQYKTVDEFDKCYENLRLKQMDIEKKYTTRKEQNLLHISRNINLIKPRKIRANWQ